VHSKAPSGTDVDRKRRLEAIQRAYAKASDENDRTRQLLAGLIMCGPDDWPLPDWLFSALRHRLLAKLPQEPGLHLGRWLMVREGKQPRLGKAKPSWEDAYAYAAERLADTRWSGLERTMKESYQIVQRERRGR
jgi:hypothetical protein